MCYCKITTRDNRDRVSVNRAPKSSNSMYCYFISWGNNFMSRGIFCKLLKKSFVEILFQMKWANCFGRGTCVIVRWLQEITEIGFLWTGPQKKVIRCTIILFPGGIILCPGGFLVNCQKNHSFKYCFRWSEPTSLVGEHVLL